MAPPSNPASRERGFCPCCGYRTLPEGRPGSYEVCPVCAWLDDPIQFRAPEGEPRDPNWPYGSAVGESDE